MKNVTSRLQGWRGKYLVAGSLLATAAAVLPLQGVRAADPYDKSLEARVEALERELNTLSNDDKGKNVTTTEVPTFLRAAGKDVQQLTIAGDLRFRYNYDNEDFQYPGGGNQLQRSRYIFRLRLNLNYTMSDNWYVALGVSTNGQSDAQNQAITEGFDDYGIYLHQFVLGYKATPWATIIMGKLFAPFYNNEDAIFDFGDINPVGLTEKLTFEISPKLSIAGNFGQYMFYDNPESGYAVTPTRVATTNAAGVVTGETVVNVYSTNPASTIPQDRKEDAILSYNDIVVTYKPTDAITLTLAPAFYCYLLHGSVGVSGNAVGAAGGRSNANSVNVANPLSPTQGFLEGAAQFNNDRATDDLYVAMFNGDVKFPVGPFKGKFYWDFAYNLDGSGRAANVYGIRSSNHFQDSTTWLTGLQLGELKKKGDWYMSADFRQYGIASLDPNTNDPNFALSRLNTQGFRINLGYNLTNWLKAEVWYYGAWNLDKNVRNLNGTLASGTIRNFFDANAVQNLMIQLTSSF